MRGGREAQGREDQVEQREERPDGGEDQEVDLRGGEPRAGGDWGGVSRVLGGRDGLGG